MPKQVDTPTSLHFTLTASEGKAIADLTKHLDTPNHKDTVRQAFSNYQKLHIERQKLAAEVIQLRSYLQDLLNSYELSTEAEDLRASTIVNVIKHLRKK